MKKKKKPHSAGKANRMPPAAEIVRRAQQALGEACNNGQATQAAQALHDGANANAATYKSGNFGSRRVQMGVDGGMTAAALAARWGHLDVLGVLAEAGSTDAAPLLLGAASLNGDEARVREALAAGADADAGAYKIGGTGRGRWGWYGMSERGAALGGHMSAAAVAGGAGHLPHAAFAVLPALAEAGSRDAVPYMLGLACYHGDEARVREALAAGADVNAVAYDLDCEGSPDYECVRIPRWRREGENDLWNECGRMTAAMVAARKGHHRAVLSALVEAGSTDAPRLMLGHACFRGDEARVREALAAGADANAAVYQTNGNMNYGANKTAAAVAAQGGAQSILAILVEAGSTDAAAQMLGLACLHGDEARVREALAAGADASAPGYHENGRTGGNMTAAAVAARKGHDFAVLLGTATAAPEAAAAAAPAPPTAAAAEAAAGGGGEAQPDAAAAKKEECDSSS